MSIVSVDNISPIGSGTSVTVNSAATLVLNNANSTGVITATSFSGDGSNLTGISVDSTKIETGNTKVETIDTGSDGHVKITTEGSERLRINSSGQLLVGATGNSTGGISEFSKSVGGGAAGCHITVENTSTNSVNNTAGIHLKTDTGTAKFFKYSAAQTFIQSAAGGASELNLQASGAHAMRFYTNGDERLRIDSAGRVGIKNTNMSSFNTGMDDLVIGNGVNGTSPGMTIFSNSSDIGSISFRDSADTGISGLIQYRHLESPPYMRFMVEGTQRMSITTHGGIAFNSDTAAANTIDDYEEGTFSPAFNTTANNLTFNGGSRTNASLYTTRQGSYVKIGKRVWFQISMSTNGLTSVGGSDFIGLDGLPFTAENDSNRPRFVMAVQGGRFNSFVPLFLVVNKGTTLCQLRESFDVQRTINYFNTDGNSNRNVIEAFGSYEIA